MKKFILSLVVLCIVSSAYAEDIKQKITTAFNSIEVEEVKELGKSGVYEVLTAQGKLLYATSDFIIVGNLISYSGENLTKIAEQRMVYERYKKVGFDKKLALKVGNGKKEVFQITDPECPFCLKSEDFFTDADVTRYIYFMPLSIHKNAYNLSVHILCSQEPEKEYYKVEKAIKDNNIESMTTVSCAAGREKVEKMMKAASDMGVNGTPFFAVGDKTFSGADESILKYIK